MSMRKKTLISCLVTILISETAVQAALTFPSQCKVSGLRYDQGQLVLFAQHTAKPRLYAIQNRSKYALWVVHTGEGMSAGWDTQFSSNHWSSILITRPMLALSCHLSLKNDKLKTVPCQSVLRVCQFSQWYAKHPISGGYWVAENLPLPKMMSHMHARGFVVG